MRTSRIASLVAVGAIFLPLLASTASAVTASPRAAPAIGTQLAMLKGSDTVAGDGFGIRVAISGTTAIVGANGHASDAGRAYVFTGTAFGWKQTAELKGSDTVAGDYLGSVAISGTTAVVGAEGHASDAGRAYVFTETAFGWTQVAELDGSDTVAGNAFGNSVAISGTTAIVGAFGAAGSAGRAYVFTGTPTGWKQTAELKGSAGAGGFGGSVAISGTTVIVGAFGPNKEPGRAYVFTKTGAAWKQVAELEGSDSVAGDSFGISVAISGTTAVVGAFDHANLAGRATCSPKRGLAGSRSPSWLAPTPSLSTTSVLRWPSRARPPSWVQRPSSPSRPTSSAGLTCSARREWAGSRPLSLRARIRTCSATRWRSRA
jgi:hypothetical protein